MYIFIVIMSNVLNALGYSRFLKKRDEFTMNYTEVKSTFDTDIYSVLKSRQKFKVVEDAILDVGSEVAKDEKPLEVKDIVIKDMKMMNKTERLEEQLGKKKDDSEKKEDNKKKEDKSKEDKSKEDKSKEDKSKEDKSKEDKPVEKEELMEPKKNLIDDNEKDFLFGTKPKKDDPDEKKIENEATFQNETKEILQEDKYKKKIVITQEALEPPKEKSPRKKK
jgi:hypothetical protein